MRPRAANFNQDEGGFYIMQAGEGTKITLPTIATDSLIIMLDLNRPIEGQITTIKQYAKSAQKKMHGKQLRTKDITGRPVKNKATLWRKWVRCLDAHDADQHDRKFLAQSIKLDKNSTPEFAWDDALKAAKVMRDIGYRQLFKNPLRLPPGI